MREPISSCALSPDGLSPSGERAFLKWAGGKRQLIPQLVSLLPPILPENSYFEPFLGSGALFLHLVATGLIKPTQARLSDNNEKLMAAWTDVQTKIGEVIEHLQNIAANYNHADPACYYALRDRYNTCSESGTERTALLIALNKTCFNGLYRESKKGLFNVPRGNYKNPNIVPETTLKAVHIALQGAELTTGSFEKTLDWAKPGDFVYFDPPYEPLSQSSSFRAYHKNGFNRTDQQRLAELVDQLTKRGVNVMLSNSTAPFIIQLYPQRDGLRLHRVTATRFINSNKDKRGAIQELVVTNYKINADSPKT
ncbi:MAG: DNA adenine methylase [Myxococcales bacterium]|nr:DNA adenine methylase [Myxococcales bacterium]